MAEMAAHMPPAEAPENTSIDTLWAGTSSLPVFAWYQASSASTRKSSTPAVYAPAEMAPAMLIAILNLFIQMTSANASTNLPHEDGRSSFGDGGQKWDRSSRARV